MNVLILSTFDQKGGAAVSARRLFKSINKHTNINVCYATLHVGEKKSTSSLFKRNFFFWLKKWILFSLERLIILLSVKKKQYLYKFSLNIIGFELYKHPLVKEADIIHLHWINFSFVSINEITRLIALRPVVWTLHDMWAFTGGCHYTGLCTNYQVRCENCYMVRFSSLSETIFKLKKRAFSKSQICLISPSTWMKQMAAQSALAKELSNHVIPNAIDIEKYRPMEKSIVRERYGLSSTDVFYVLFGAMDLNDTRKGFVYLYKVLRQLSISIPNLHLLTFGSNEVQLDGLTVTSFGQVNSEQEIVEIYNLADVFVLPSIEDNLPNTIMEAMSCGIPVVAFDCGGVGDMINHKKNGFLAHTGHEDGLSDGIKYFQDNETRLKAGREARVKVSMSFAEKIIANQHIDLYRQLILNYKKCDV